MHARTHTPQTLRSARSVHRIGLTFDRHPLLQLLQRDQGMHRIVASTTLRTGVLECFAVLRAVPATSKSDHSDRWCARRLGNLSSRRLRHAKPQSRERAASRLGLRRGPGERGRCVLALYARSRCASLQFYRHRQASRHRPAKMWPSLGAAHRPVIFIVICGLWGAALASERALAQVGVLSFRLACAKRNQRTGSAAATPRCRLKSRAHINSCVSSQGVPAVRSARSLAVSLPRSGTRPWLCNLTRSFCIAHRLPAVVGHGVGVCVRPALRAGADCRESVHTRSVGRLCTKLVADMLFTRFSPHRSNAWSLCRVRRAP